MDISIETSMNNLIEGKRKKNLKTNFIALVVQLLSYVTTEISFLTEGAIGPPPIALMVKKLIDAIRSFLFIKTHFNRYNQNQI